MANEFKIKNGFLSEGNSQITGSLIVTGGITGSLQGTASFAVTASHALNAGNATSSSYATTSSYALNGGVTQLLAGPNVTLSPTNGLGQVTISSTSGGGGFNTATGSYGSFYDTTTQTNPVANIPRSMSLNTTDITNGVSVSGSTNPFNTYIKTENAGVYDIQFSAQLDKTDGGSDEIVIWLRKNGTDLTDTATTITLSSSTRKQVAAWNWFINSAANDYYQIIWQSDDTNVRLLAEPTDGHPGIPSVIVTANRVDQFLSNTGSFSGSFNGVFTGSLQGTASYALSASYAPGGGGTPGGSNQAVQFNNNGTLGGETFFRYNSGNRSVSNGSNVTSSGEYSHAEGSSSISSGKYSHTEGNTTQTGFDQGYIATGADTCSLDASYGNVTSSYNPGDQILFDDSAYDNVFGIQTFIVNGVDWNGTNTILIFEPLTGISTTTAVIGNLTTGTGTWTGGYSIGGAYSHAEGQNTRTIGLHSHAEGSNTTTYGYASHAEGVSTQATGYGSHAEGTGTITSGQYSHAEGSFTQASGTGSHAEGYQTTSSGNYSHAEGERTTANGVSSHAEGNTTQTGFDQGYLATAVGSGTCSLDASYGDVSAEYTTGDIILFDDTPFDNIYGVQTFIVASVNFIGGITGISFTDISINTTTAIIGNLTTGTGTWAGGYPIGGNYSHAEGIGTIALGVGQHVSGQYNTLDYTSLFIVGNGTRDDNRLDAFKVTPSGSIILPNIQPTEPAWDGVNGEMIFSDDGAGTYTMYVWLDRGWRSVSLA
jgi:hypothetical protein